MTGSTCWFALICSPSFLINLFADFMNQTFQNKPQTILLTGAAGFIGAYVGHALIARGQHVVGIDNFNDYYDPQLKHDRVAALIPSMQIFSIDVGDKAQFDSVFDQIKPSAVIHLAAQAGVRFSIDSPYTYLHSNLAGFLNLIEACRRQHTAHLVYASSSSVYGFEAKAPFTESAKIDKPLSLYAATKAANELMAHAYAHLFRIPMTGLRFFTVYGPWGRPDMAPILFSRAILAGRPIQVFNHGKMRRDFTYIDDIVQGVISALDHPPTLERDVPPHRVFNLGNNQPVELKKFIATIELAADRKAIQQMQGMQAGDMLETMADLESAARELGFCPQTSIEDGLPKLVQWCRDYFADHV